MGNYVDNSVDVAISILPVNSLVLSSPRASAGTAMPPVYTGRFYVDYIVGV